MQLTEYLKDIADAIRENTGKTETIAAQTFKDEITKLSELDAGVYSFALGDGGTGVNNATVNTLPGNLVLAFVCVTTDVTYPDLEGWTKIEPSIISNTNRITDEKMDIWYKITESTTETIHVVTSASTNLATALMSFKNMQIVPTLDQVKGGHSVTFTDIKKGDLICCVNPWYNMGGYMREPYSINIKCNKYLGWYKYYFTIFEALEDVASATVSSSSSYNGYGVLQMNRPTLSNSLRAGVTHGKTVGTFTSDATATKNDIVSGKSAYVNGEKIDGQVTEYQKGYGGSVNQTLEADQAKTGYINGIIQAQATASQDFLARKGSTISVYVNDSIVASAGQVTAKKIAAGETALGISGTFTSDADAIAEDIIENKSAYVNGNKIIGTLQEVKQGASTAETYDAVTADETNKKLKVSKQFTNDKVYRAGSGISVDVAYNEIVTTTKLTPEKLVQGETVLGVTGTTIPLSSTLDATATINDISQGKTAYVNGVKITGTLMEAGKLGLVPKTMEKSGSGYEVTSYINGEYIVRNVDTNMTLSNQMIADAIELTSDKILTGQTVLGIDGTGKSGIDTDTATALPSDIAEGVTAVVNNTLITGTVKTIEGNTDTRLNMSGVISTSGDSKLLTGQTTLDGDTLFRDGAKFSVQYNMNNYAFQLGVSPEKVVLGHNILGVEGTGLGLDTSDATARATDLALGETAYVNNQKITGTLQEVATGSHRLTSETIIGIDGTDLIFTADNTIDRIVRKDVDLTIGASQSAVAAAIGLTAPKIIQGQTILGIEGTADVTLELDTFDATAVAADLREGKTAYVAGEKITGTSKEVATLETRVKTTTEDGNGKIYFQANEVAEGFYTPNTLIKLEMTTAELASKLGITADVIKEGVTILGITGTHKGTTEEGGDSGSGDSGETGGGTTTTVVTYPSYDNLVQDTTQSEGTMGLVDNTAYVATNSGTAGQTMWVPTVTYNDAKDAYQTLTTVGTEISATAYDGMGATEEEIQATFNEIM